MKLALALLAAGAIAPAAPVEKTKLALTESLRYESKTTGDSFGGSSWSQTEEAWRSKVTITVEFPIIGTELNADTKVDIKVGKFSFVGKLGDDKNYSATSNSVKLIQTAATEGPTRSVTGRAELKWTKDKLVAKIIGDTEGVTSPAAIDFRGSQVGKVEGVVPASVQIGEAKMNFDLPVRGTVARKTASGPGISGSATTVNLKGEVSTQ